MASILTGLVDDQDILQDERVVQMAEAAHQLDSDTSQFTTILDKLPQGTLKGTERKWREDEYLPSYTSVSGAHTDADNTIAVAAGTGAYFKPGTVAKVIATGEKVHIQSVAGDVLTVVRGIGSAAAAAISDGAKLLIIGSAYAQGADTPESRAVKRVLGYNYTQIVRDSLSFSRSMVQSQTYGGNERDIERRKKLVEHKRQLEDMFVEGGRDLDLSGDEPVGFCGGALEFISTNSWNVGGNLGADFFDSKMTEIFAHGDAGSKVAFAGPTAARALSKMLRDAWAPSSVGDRLYGAKVDGFINGAFGWQVPVMVKRNWLSDGRDGRIVVLDLSLVKRHTLQETVLLTNRQGNGQDRVTEEYLSEMTLEFAQEKAHGLFYGITL